MRNSILTGRNDFPSCYRNAIISSTTVGEQAIVKSPRSSLSPAVSGHAFLSGSASAAPRRKSDKRRRPASISVRQMRIGREHPEVNYFHRSIAGRRDNFRYSRPRGSIDRLSRIFNFPVNVKRRSAGHLINAAVYAGH